MLTVSSHSGIFIVALGSSFSTVHVTFIKTGPFIIILVSNTQNLGLPISQKNITRFCDHQFTLGTYMLAAADLAAVFSQKKVNGISCLAEKHTLR